MKEYTERTEATGAEQRLADALVTKRLTGRVSKSEKNARKKAEEIARTDRKRVVTRKAERKARASRRANR